MGKSSAATGGYSFSMDTIKSDDSAGVEQAHNSPIAPKISPVPVFHRHLATTAPAMISPRHRPSGKTNAEISFEKNIATGNGYKTKYEIRSTPVKQVKRFNGAGEIRKKSDGWPQDPCPILSSISSNTRARLGQTASTTLFEEACL
jgi:hypothetical protein